MKPKSKYSLLLVGVGFGATFLVGGVFAGTVSGVGLSEPPSRELIQDIAGGKITIYQAAQTGDTEALSFLIDDGADLDALSPEGEAALHHAAYGGQAAAIRMLLLAGANQHILDAAGRTPLQIAQETQQQESIQALSEAVPGRR